MAEEIIMRIAEPQDADSLRELINETIDTCYFHIYPQEAIDYFKNYHNRTNIVNDILEGHCLILASGEEFIGTGTLFGSNARRVFVKPGYQKMGLGKRIMYDLEEKAVEKGVGIMDLDASLVAYPFYRALGYETQAEDVIPVKNGQNLRYYKMVKKLGDKSNCGRTAFSSQVDFSKIFKNSEKPVCSSKSKFREEKEDPEKESKLQSELQ